MKLISLDVAVEEIEKRFKYNSTRVEVDRSSFMAGKEKEDEDILTLLNTLEVKEVDLDKEAERFVQTKEFIESTESPIILVAKHFFELGMRVNNPITAADRGMAEEIIVNLKRVEQDYRIDLTKEMEWLRNKVKKGEEL